LVGSAVVLISMSQSAAPANPPRDDDTVRARDMVQIREGTPYAVPAEKMFVLTGVGSSEIRSEAYVSLRVNGKHELCALVSSNGTGGSGGSSSVAPVPVGFAVPSGATIDVNDQREDSSWGRAWGYLANQ
jgi:hypothetical protein